MASKSLTFDIFGRDRTASKSLNKVGDAALFNAKKVQKITKAFKAMALAIALGTVAFGVSAVKAAAAAETEQLKLTAAWDKFPKTADLAIEALREYNAELAKKTKFDDEAIGSGQAVLAQFKLSGKQIQKLTPLLLDYAARTGKDLPTAATDLGKALLGQGRALKAIGINFVDTGTEAGNFEALVAALSTQVGGFAEKEGTTAAGKLAILENRFGEVQEAIGVALMPTLSDLIDFTNETVLPGLETFSGWFTETGLPAIKDFIAWVVQYKDILGPTAVAVGVLTTAQWALNAAMLANPVGLVIASVIGLIGYVAALATDFGGIRTTLVGFQRGMLGFFIDVQLAIMRAFQGAANALIGFLNKLLVPINTIRNALGLGSLALNPANFTSGLMTLKGNLGTLNNGAYTPSGSNTMHVPGPTAGRFAEGGIVPARPGGWTATVGEGGQAEAIIPLDRWGQMGGGTTVYVTVPAGFVGDENKLAQTIVRTLDRAKSRGAIPRNALS